MFGITFDGHPHLRRILMPPTWNGHPLRKEHPARATEMGPFSCPTKRPIKRKRSELFRPEDWGMKAGREDSELHVPQHGPQHPEHPWPAPRHP